MKRWIVGLAIAACAVLAGCAQNTDAPAKQETQTPSHQAQDTFGGHDAKVVIFQTGGEAQEFPLQPGETHEDAELEGAQTTADANGFGKAKATYIQTITIRYDQAGTTTPTASQAANVTPSQSSSVAPQYRVDPNLVVPLAFGMPGSAPTANGSGATNGNASQDATTTAHLATQLAQLKATNPSVFESLLTWLQGGVPQTPGDTPAPTPTPAPSPAPAPADPAASQ